MVNMNAADDKQNKSKSSRTNGLTDDERPCSSAFTENSESTQVKLIENGSLNSDCTEYSTTNGAYPIGNCHSNVSLTPACEGPSVSITCPLNSFDGDPHLAPNESRLGHNEKNMLFKQNEGENHFAVLRQANQSGTSACDYDKSSSSEDEECCIYTYKGDANQMADLPSSFYRMDMMNARLNANSGNSSPDMDYLEMDFDPGPSNDRYSSSDSGGEEEMERDAPIRELPHDLNSQASREPQDSVPEERGQVDNAPSPQSPMSTPSPVEPDWLPRFLSEISSLEPNLSVGVNRSVPTTPLRQIPTTQVLNKDITQTPSCYCISNKLSPVSIDENYNEGDSGTMIWKEQEAKEKDVNQSGTSQSGVTAVINTLQALNVPFCVGAVKYHIAARVLNDSAPVVEYLLSRSQAGATHEDIIRGLHGASHDLVYARFFPMYPQRSISLTSWLSHWIRKGAVPIATLNPQRGVGLGAEFPDSWHHQMIHGVGIRGVYLTNPLEVASDARLWPQLASPTELRVQSDDVLSRWTRDTYLLPLADPSRPHWRKMNVLGQVVNVVREGSLGRIPPLYVTIPLECRSGVTLAVLRTSPAYDELRLAPELPIDPFASS